MTTNFVLVAIVFVVFALLQIILFFKVWGMTINIKTIKNRTINPTHLDNARIAYLYGNKEVLERELRLSFWKILKSSIRSNLTDIQYAQIFDVEKKRFSIIYKDYGINMPDFEEYRNWRMI